MTLRRHPAGMFFLGAAVSLCFVLLLISAPAQAGASGGGGSSSSPAPTCAPFSTAPPTLAQIPGYAPASPGFYPDRAPINDAKFNSVVPAAVQNAWYNNMPSPGLCSNAQSGVCLSSDFGNLEGVKVAAITATTSIVFGTIPTAQVGVDAVVTTQTNSCGQTATDWSWVTTPSSGAVNMNVPQNTTVQVSYSCVPNQTYDWTTSTSCFLGIGTCNVARHARTYFFANEAMANGSTTSSVLHGQDTFVPTAGKTYTLACGGDRPENGSATPPSYNATSKTTGVCIFGIDCSGGGDFASYNVADSSYWQPGITFSVNQCSGSDDVVVNNVCTPCATIKPGSHRVDNVCVSSIPVLGIDALVGGQSVSSVPLGTKVTIQGTYVSTSSDPITGVQINGGTGDQNTSVCGTKNCLSTTYGAQKATATSTYTFAPTAVGTYTFYPSVETTILSAWQNYGTVSKTITITPPCPANAKQSGNTCVCTQQYFSYIGNSCVLTCPPAMHSNKASGSCVANLPTANQIQFTATRIRVGDPSTLSWTIGGMAAGITCDITPHETLKTLMPAWSGSPSWSGSLQTKPISGVTNFTLTCGNGDDAPVSKTVTVQIIPAYQEI